MLLVLPLAALAGLVLVFRCGGHGWRMSAVAGAVVWAGLLTLLTEALSLLGAIGRPGLSLAWLGVVALIGLVLVRRDVRSALRPPARLALERGDRLALGALGVVYLITLVVGLAAPPTAVDSMTYHMARVANWASNGTVAHYPTHVPKQLFTQPWSEYAMLHIYVLSGSDRLASLVQWSAMVGSTVAASLIAGQLGAALSGQIVAGLIVATLPIGIAQASSTLNGYVNAFWLLCVALLVVRGPGGERRGWSEELLLGLALGAAGLTKGTAYIYGLPLVLWLSARWIRRYRWRVVPRLALIGVVALALNLAFYARNHQLFGSPLGAVEEETPVVSQTFSPALLAGNIVRHASLQIGTPWAAVNEALGDGIVEALSWIGDDSDDPRILWPPFRINAWPQLNEGAAQNTWHALLILVAVALLIRHRHRFDRRHAGLLLAAVAGVLLIAMLVKWRSWQSRHHLAFLAMGSALAAAVVYRVYGVAALRRIGLIFFLLGLPWMVRDQNRPLLGRSYNVLTAPKEEQYFVMRREAMDDYLGMAERAAALECRSFGLYLSTHFEYPIWALLQRRGDVRIQHVAVQNRSGGLPEPGEFEPCALVTTRGDSLPRGLELEPLYGSEWISLYRIVGGGP